MTGTGILLYRKTFKKRGWGGGGMFIVKSHLWTSLGTGKARHFTYMYPSGVGVGTAFLYTLQTRGCAPLECVISFLGVFFLFQAHCILWRKSKTALFTPYFHKCQNLQKALWGLTVLWGAWEQPPRGAPGYQVLSDILFRLGLIANCSHTVQ